MIPSGVSIIEYEAFEGCTSLQSITFPANIKIELNAFKGCTSLESCVPDGVMVGYESGLPPIDMCAMLTVFLLEANTMLPQHCALDLPPHCASEHWTYPTIDIYMILTILDPAALASNGAAYDPASGKCEIICPSSRRMEQEAQADAPESAADAIVDGFLAQNPAYLAKLRNLNTDEEATDLMKQILPHFGRPALAQDERASA